MASSSAAAALNINSKFSNQILLAIKCFAASQLVKVSHMKSLTATAAARGDSSAFYKVAHKKSFVRIVRPTYNVVVVCF